MRRLIVGTAGHIDHGKTALVRALTGTDTDRLPEERKRGITIDLGFADLRLYEDCHAGIVDVPGHEGFVRNMLAGATGVDLGLLIVAADEGVMPQTREHLAILDLLGVRGLVVALTKADLADLEWRDLAVQDVRQLLDGGPYEDSPIAIVSARTGEGLDALTELLAREAQRITTRDVDDVFRLPVDRVFTVRGTGTVVTGTIWSGTVQRDQSVRLLPVDRKIRVRGVQSHGSEQERAGAGQRSALALVGIDRSDVRRGDVLVAGEGWSAGRILTVKLRILPDAPAVRRGQRVRFHLGTVEALGRIVPLGAAAVSPGAETWAQLRLEEAVVARAGDRFVVRSYSPVTTIGGGLVAEPTARKRKRPGPDVLQRLEQVLAQQPGGAAEAAVWLAGWAGMPAQRLPIAAPIPAKSIDRIIAETPGIRPVGRSLFHQQVIDEARRRILESLQRHHGQNPLAPGLSREELRQVLPSPNPDLADHVISELHADQQIEIDRHTARLAGFEPRLSPEQDMIAAQLRDLYRQAGLAAPAVNELPGDLAARGDVEDMLRHLMRAGDLVAAGPGRYFDRATVDRAAELMRESLGTREGLSPGDFRDLFGISRKYLIPLLEYFDRTGVTVRTGEVRSLAPLDTPHEPGAP